MRWLLVPLPVLGVAYLAGVLAGAAPARPGAVWGLAIFPALALVPALARRAVGVLAFALLELALLVPLDGLVTFVRAWRLEGG